LGVDELIAHYSASRNRTALTDGLGSVLAHLRADASSETEVSFSAYGESAKSGAAPLGSTGYTGREDDGTQQVFYRARFYDPVLKRFTQSDPIGLAGGINTYAYVEGNPVSYTDPTGKFIPQLIGFGIGAGLEYLTNPCASATDLLLAGGLGALGGGLSKAAFLRLGPRSLTRETGLEWSHSIARRNVNQHTSGGLNRALNQRGGLNGSWRTPASHARHDASRHVPGVDPMPLPLRALDRIPDWLKGTGLGGGVGAAVAGGDCACR
jgi:RHS repeat-associated protein